MFTNSVDPDVCTSTRLGVYIYKGLSHIIFASIDTVILPTTPAGQETIIHSDCIHSELFFF